MRKFWVTMGQGHRHVINKVVIDKDSVLEIDAHDEEQARGIANSLFNKVWSFMYHEKPNMNYFPRGIIRLEDITKMKTPRVLLSDCCDVRISGEIDPQGFDG